MTGGIVNNMQSGNDEDWFDNAPTKPKYGIQQGRYMYPPPPGYEFAKGERGFMRMTNLASAFSDQKRLQAWRERMILLGLRTGQGEVLYDELMAADLMSMPDPKAWLEDMANKMANAAGADHGARRGTARHTMLQAFQETGVITGTRTMRLQMDSFLEALDRHHLEPLPGWSERRVCNTRYRVMGTLDLGVMCRRTGQVGIMDLKTQRSFWSYQEISGQQTGYDSADWVWEGPADESGRWVRPEHDWNLTGADGGEFEGRRVALLAHMPQEPGPNQLPVEIHEVALDYGHEVLEVACRNVDLRSRGKSVAAGRRIGAVRRLPVRVDTPTIVM